MRLRNTLLFLIVFALLGSYIYWVELKDDLDEKGKKLLSFREEDVESMVLNYSDQKIRLNRQPSGKWVLTHPLSYPADEPVIQGILSALTSSEIKRTIEKNPNREDLATFGLDKPWVRLLIKLKDGNTPTAILIGGRTPVGYSAYVKRANELAVLLTSASLRSSLEKKLYDFRDKHILRIEPEKVAKVEIETETEVLVLARGEEGNWRMELPQMEKAKESTVSAFLRDLFRLRAKAFADNEPMELTMYGLDPPSLRITLAGKAEEQLGALLVGQSSSGEVYAKREGNPTIYTIDGFSYTQINKTAADFAEEENSESQTLGQPTN